MFLGVLLGLTVGCMVCGRERCGHRHHGGVPCGCGGYAYRYEYGYSCGGCGCRW